MGRFYSFFLILSLVGCGYGIETRPVSFDRFLNDNSSKVWLVSQKYVGGAPVETARSGFREVFIFYKSTKVIVQPLNSLGNTTNFRGYYVLSEDNKTIRFEMPKENWFFNITSFNEQKIVLTGTKGNRRNEKLVLIPLPEDF